MTRRRRRTLRFAMWVCVACSAIAAALWAFSGWYWFDWSYSSPANWAGLKISAGDIQAGWGRHDFSTKASVGTTLQCVRAEDVRWAGTWRVDSGFQGLVVNLPLWFVSLAFAVVACLFLRLSRRPIPGLCPRCRYDLSGSPTGVCPECGAAADATAAP